MAAERTRLHLPITAAICTGLYAGSLGLVTAQQAEHDAATARQNAPLLDAATRARAEREAAGHALRGASAALGAATDAYAAVTDASREVDAVLQELASGVEAASGAAARLPTAVRLPSAPSAVTPVAAPVTNGTTGASGQ
jgi:nucleotidyltransferase/DNA polymerase involved in DNA repair